MADDQPVERLSIQDVTSILGLIKLDLSAMETRITDAMKDTVAADAQRWAKHDEESERILKAWDARFGVLEKSVEEHHHEAELNRVGWDARISPLRNAIAFLSAKWKDLLLLLFVILGFFAMLADMLARYLGFGT